MYVHFHLQIINQEYHLQNHIKLDLIPLGMSQLMIQKNGVSLHYSHSGWMVKCRGMARCGRVNMAMVLETGPGCRIIGR